MIQTATGAILLAFPLIGALLFSDRRKGLACVILYILASHVALGFFSQLLHIFYREVIFWGTFLADAAALFVFLFFKKKKQKLDFKLSWPFYTGMFVIFVSAASLYMVHFDYTGRVSTVFDKSTDYQKVEHYEYPYPYFSDEWYGVSLMESSLKNHNLPLFDLLSDKPFLNLEVFTHSFLAEQAMLLDLKPLYGYVWLSIYLNSLIVFLTFLFLFIAGVSEFGAAICSLMVLYITCGANMPGIWNLVPITLGVVFLLLWMCFMELGDEKKMLFSALCASLFYPLLAPFYGSAIAVYFYERKKMPCRTAVLILALLFAAGLLFFLPPAFLKYIFSRAYYNSFSGSYIPQFNLFHTAPVPAIILACFALFFTIKQKKWLAAQLVVGTIYWITYSFSTHRFLIEFERAVYYTCILVCILAGFGIWILEKKVKKAKLIEICLLGISLAILPYYTQREGWAKIVNYNPVTGNYVYPKAPANHYLTEDDVRLFSGINGKKFLSFPWKGTVIGVATGNHPALIKQGTISFGNPSDADYFNSGNCSKKKEISKRLGLQYVYLYPFDCKGFEKIGESPEGIVLYELKK